MGLARGGYVQRHLEHKYPEIQRENLTNTLGVRGQGQANIFVTTFSDFDRDVQQAETVQGEQEISCCSCV